MISSSSREIRLIAEAYFFRRFIVMILPATPPLTNASTWTAQPSSAILRSGISSDLLYVPAIPARLPEI